ncbi:FabD/lysophospholipase-like protein [Mycena venus]|uniref:FabD/lysophospholipase-like protein n=1 Tax=Mycena venus TaxID=2733690 RepID=A0A8H6Z410_9AGAR|nr:FabD/lysophospholipase-like protein [Mycena venus]
MLSQDDSRSLYITGGQGGPGGQGYLHGTGGPGGAGLGPNVHITAQQLIAHNLYATLASEQAFKLSNIRASQILNHCPPPSRIFHGRRNILDKMHDFFSSNMGSQHIYVLYGLGGAGKTQIGLKFINESSSCFSDIFFIDTSTIVTIETGLKNIAVAKDFGDSPQDGLLWLTSKVEEWLLFFDNADDPSINLNDFIPQCTHGNIIITSRNPGLCVYAGSHSLVSDMEEEDAVALLLKSAAQEVTFSTQKNATEIIKALHYLPLAIVQAGAFISKSQDLHGYLALYTKNQAQLLSEKPAQPHDRYAWTVYTTWQISFDRLRPSAAMFLLHCSFLHHNGITEEIFSHASKYTFQSDGPSKEELQGPLEFLSHFLGPSGEWATLQFLNVTNEIQAYSLISFDSEKKLFSIHPLVHAWSRVIVCNPERYMSTIGSILGMAISEHPNQSIELASVVLCPHVEFVVQMNAKVALYFSVQYGLMFSGAGKYKQAEKLLKEVLEKWQQLLGDNHPDTLLAMSNLASTYSDLGEHQKAEELQIIVLEKRKQLLGDSHPATLLTMGNLASTYADLGEYQKAEELKIIVLEKWKQLLGDSHPDTLLAMGNLASTYADLGEHRKAEELQIIVLEKRKQLLGDSHPATLLTMGNLASIYSDLGEHQKAEELKVIVLEKRKQLLGDSHPNTLLAMGNLASTYSDLGEHQKAEESKIIVLEKQKQLLGDNHPDTLLTMSNLARTYANLGEHQKAEELEIIVLEKRKQLLGDSHPDTLLTMGNLASTYSDLGEHQKAEELQIIVLEKQKQLLGDSHPNTLLTMGNLASTYSDLGEHQKAEELKIIVLEKQKQLLGDNHPDTLLTMGNLARTYANLGEHQKAKELEIIVLEKQQQLLGDSHPATLLTMGNLASTYSDLGEHQKAEELIVIVLEKQRQLLGDNHPHTLHTMGNLATLQSRRDLSDSDTPIPPKGVLMPDQPFILTLMARMQDMIVERTESDVD